jgi:DNA-binding response OmpR family regulator
VTVLRAKGRETVLLVDDEPLLRQTSRDVLRKLGYSILEATSGDEALRIFEEKKDQIDLVILDMVMPGMDGSDLFEGLKAIEPQVNTLVLSGFGSEEDIHDMMNRGCGGFIMKPYDIEQLSQRIREILDRPGRVGPR